jgi:hypothetical protein
LLPYIHEHSAARIVTGGPADVDMAGILQYYIGRLYEGLILLFNEPPVPALNASSPEDLFDKNAAIAERFWLLSTVEEEEGTREDID